MGHEMNVRFVEGNEEVKAGTLVLFEENYLSGVGVAVFRAPWCKFAASEYTVPEWHADQHEEYLAQQFNKIRKGEVSGVPVVILGQMIGSFMHGGLASAYPFQDLRFRRFAFIKRDSCNIIYKVDNPAILRIILGSRLFTKDINSSYLLSLKYELLVLSSYLQGAKPGQYSETGNRLFDLFEMTLGVRRKIDKKS
jgi:hypothetical protein